MTRLEERNALRGTVRKILTCDQHIAASRQDDLIASCEKEGFLKFADSLRRKFAKEKVALARSEENKRNCESKINKLLADGMTVGSAAIYHSYRGDIEVTVRCIKKWEIIIKHSTLPRLSYSANPMIITLVKG
ncbi:MAG: hypothetical protein Q8O94_00115 [bacterium]|nr:hypothetical protein [bacterium]